MKGTGTVKVVVKVTHEGRFTFDEESNDTEKAVLFDAVLRTFGAYLGDYDLILQAKGFAFANPPLKWEGEVPVNIPYELSADQKTLTLHNFNDEKELQEARFILFKDDGTWVDPTILNNPLPPPGNADVRHRRMVRHEEDRIPVLVG